MLIEFVFRTYIFYIFTDYIFTISSALRFPFGTLLASSHNKYAMLSIVVEHISYIRDFAADSFRFQQVDRFRDHNLFMVLLT